MRPAIFGLLILETNCCLLFQRVAEPDLLTERLLCVEVSEVKQDVIRKVLELVAATAPFASFLPLANRVREHLHLHLSHITCVYVWLASTSVWFHRQHDEASLFYKQLPER